MKQNGGVNPYYTSVDELMETSVEAQNDEMLQKMVGIWSGQTIVYGPIWPLICKILSGLSIANVYLMYKITNKKVFMLIYGLNPAVLFEGIVNVHNEMLVIFFLLLGLYFFIKKKNILLTVTFFALATLVKYFAILLIPFIILYFYRKETIPKKILYSFLWAIVFILILTIVYAMYMKDFEVLKGVFVQQNKLANSIFLSFFLLFDKKNLMANGFMIAFICIYGYTIINLIFTKKEYKFSEYIRKYNTLLLIFIFATITSFQSWYTLWIFPTIMWQNSKNIKWCATIPILADLSTIWYFLLCESYIYGIYYCLTLLGLMLLSKVCINCKKKEIKCLEK